MPSQRFWSAPGLSLLTGREPRGPVSSTTAELTPLVRASPASAAEVYQRISSRAICPFQLVESSTWKPRTVAVSMVGTVKVTVFHPVVSVAVAVLWTV